MRTKFVPLLAGLAFLCGATAASAVDPSARLDPYRGHVTYVDFWASWCGPCAQSIPWLNGVQKRYAARGLRVVGIGLDEKTVNGDRFLGAHPADFSIVRDPAGALAEFYGVEGMPYSLLLDEQGRVIHRHTGFREGEIADYEKAIDQALGASGVAQ